MGTPVGVAGKRERAAPQRVRPATVRRVQIISVFPDWAPPDVPLLITISVSTYLVNLGLKTQSNLIRWLEEGVYSQTFKSFPIFQSKF